MDTDKNAKSDALCVIDLLTRNSKVSQLMSNFIRADLKRPDQYGVYLWWPEEGTEWVHPYDVPKALDHIPSNTVFRKSEFDEEYSLISSGDLRIRVKPALWLPIAFEGFNIDDFVEVKSEFGRNEAFVAVVCEMKWQTWQQRIEYRLARAGRRLPKTYLAKSLRHADRLNRVPVRPAVKINQAENTGTENPNAMDAI